MQRQSRREDLLTSSYLTAYWQRVKKLPSLKKILDDAKPKKREAQTPEQMFAAIKHLHAKLSGGEEG